MDRNVKLLGIIQKLKYVSRKGAKTPRKSNYALDILKTINQLFLFVTLRLCAKFRF
jgi:hypothetical protein